jgi:hypothetical protein
MTIGSSHGPKRDASYNCVNARYKRGCTNRRWIKESRLSGQLIDALANKLLVPEVLEYFIESVSKDFEAFVRGNGNLRVTSLEELRVREAQLKKGAANLVAAIMSADSANSTFLPKSLSEVEAELAQVREKIRMLDAPEKLNAATLKWNTQTVRRILRNERYRGVLVWNRTRLTRDPETGAIRRYRVPTDEICRVDAPHLRIVDAAVAAKVDERLSVQG